MKFIRFGLVAAGLLTGSMAANAQPAIDLVTPGLEYPGGLYTLGFEFTVNSSTTITALGVYDSGGNPLASSAQVGIWDTSGNLLTSATVPAGTSGDLIGLFRYVDISGFDLNAGTDYLIGAFTTSLASSLGTAQGGTGSVDANVNIVQDQFSPFNSAFSFPSSSNGWAGGAWLGANFIMGTVAVPEPATLSLLCLGLAAIGFTRRRKAS